MSQQTAPHTAAAKKKKSGGGGTKNNAVDAAVAGAAGDAHKTHEKKPLHTSMEQLQMQAATTVPKTKPNANRRSAGSNWNSAMGVTEVPPTATSAANSRRNSLVKKDSVVAVCSGDEAESISGNAENAAPTQSKAARLRQKRKAAQRNKYLAMDCEMVGVGFNGQDDMLARVSIVNKNGDVLLDKFVKAREAVIDYRTSVSGIRPHDIEHGEDFNVVQDQVVELLSGKILVGHGIRNDLSVLHIKHPFANIRDTSRYKPLCRLVANGRTPSLKRVCMAILGVEIQTGEHNSVEDARAAMNIYNRLSGDWEKYIQKHHQRK